MQMFVILYLALFIVREVEVISSISKSNILVNAVKQLSCSSRALPLIPQQSYFVRMSSTDYNFDSDVLKARKSDYPIHPMLLSRASPREMTGEEMTDTELMTLFEAGRWAPSHYNLQPWRFIYAKRGSKDWQKFFDLLWPLNQEWVKNASVLVVVVSNKYFKYQDQKTLIPSHSYDAGAAWMSIALEGTARGYCVHGIGGFDYDKTYEVLNIPKDSHNVDAMITIGKRHPSDKRKKENITQRNPVKNYVFEGNFVNNDKI